MNEMKWKFSNTWKNCLLERFGVLTEKPVPENMGFGCQKLKKKVLNEVIFHFYDINSELSKELFNENGKKVEKCVYKGKR